MLWSVARVGHIREAAFAVSPSRASSALTWYGLPEARAAAAKSSTARLLSPGERGGGAPLRPHSRRVGAYSRLIQPRSVHCVIARHIPARRWQQQQRQQRRRRRRGWRHRRASLDLTTSSSTGSSRGLRRACASRSVPALRQLLLVLPVRSAAAGGGGRCVGYIEYMHAESD